MTKKISIVTPCYNEEFNVEPLYEKVKIEMAKLSNYSLHLSYMKIQKSLLGVL